MVMGYLSLNMIFKKYFKRPNYKDKFEKKKKKEEEKLKIWEPGALFLNYVSWQQELQYVGTY
jgi:hypothetical protein